MLKIQLKFIITIVLVLGFSISLQSLIAAWQEPTVSPPGDNTDTPINRGSVTQDKLGGLNIGGSMGVGQDLIINGRMAINTSTSSSRLKLLDNSGGPDIYIEGIGVNPEMALGNNLNYWSIYSDETNSDELRFWRGDNRMALTDSGTLKIKEICDEAGNNCIDISAGMGGIGSVPKNAVVAFNSTACPSDWQIADGTNGTPDLRGRFIRGLDSGGSNNDPDSPRTLASYQADELKSHRHSLSAGTVSRASGTGHHGGNIHSSNSGLYSDYTGGSETRPVNIALTYCVKMTDGGSNIDWSDISNIPPDIADGDDVGGTNVGTLSCQNRTVSISKSGDTTCSGYSEACVTGYKNNSSGNPVNSANCFWVNDGSWTGGTVTARCCKIQ